MQPQEFPQNNNEQSVDRDSLSQQMQYMELQKVCDDGYQDASLQEGGNYEKKKDDSDSDRKQVL